MDKYAIGRKVGKWLIVKGQPLNSPFFSGVYQEFYNHMTKRLDPARSPGFAALCVLHRNKHDELIKVSTALTELTEKHKDLSIKYSNLVRQKQV